MSFVNDLVNQVMSNFVFRCQHLLPGQTLLDACIIVIPYSTLANVSPIWGYQVLRGDGSILIPRRINRDWLKPSMAVSNSLQ